MLIYGFTGKPFVLFFVLKRSGFYQKPDCGAFSHLIN